MNIKKFITSATLMMLQSGVRPNKIKEKELEDLSNIYEMISKICPEITHENFEKDMFTFGKHKGKHIHAVPKEYLTWFLQNVTNVNEDFKKQVEEHLNGNASFVEDDIPF